MLHMIEHWMGWNTGEVVSKWDSEGCLWVAYQCHKCGKVSSPSKTQTKITKP